MPHSSVSGLSGTRDCRGTLPPTLIKFHHTIEAIDSVRGYRMGLFRGFNRPKSIEFKSERRFHGENV